MIASLAPPPPMFSKVPPPVFTLPTTTATTAAASKPAPSSDSGPTSISATNGAAAPQINAGEVRLVWTNEEYSMEEIRAQLPKYKPKTVNPP